MVLHNGGISEMKTGEGKTLVSTLAAFLNSLSGKGVHIVTVNDYLARRDAEWMGSIFNYLGLSVGCLTNDTEGREKRKEQYAAARQSRNTHLRLPARAVADTARHRADAVAARADDLARRRGRARAAHRLYRSAFRRPARR